MNQSKIENGQPEQKPNSEQTADSQLVIGRNLHKGMTVYDKKGKEWVVLSCDNLHNVHLIKKGKGLLINLNGKDIECGGSDLCCYVENCNEFINNPSMYYCR